MTDEEFVVSKSAVRDLVIEALDNKKLSKSVMDPFVVSHQINPVVSPAAPYDQPLNPDFIPQDKQEFIVAMQRAVKDFDDEDVPKMYAAVSKALEEFGIDAPTRIEREKRDHDDDVRRAACNKKKDEKNMVSRDVSQKQEEAKIRRFIKNILKEAWGGPSTSGLGAAQEWGSGHDEPASKKSSHEKNIMGRVPAKQVAGELGIGALSTYVKYEQQLLNKFASILLDPSTPKSKRESLKAAYIRTILSDFMEELALYLSDEDPEVKDDFSVEFFTSYKDPKFIEQMYMTDMFRKYLEDGVDKDIAELGLDQEEAKDVKDDIMTAYGGIGHGYARLDHAADDFKRLLKLYKKERSDDESSEKEFDKTKGAHGRKHLATKAVKGEDEEEV